MISTKTLGISLIMLAIAVPAVAYVAGHLYNMDVASYGGPPNQGAMALAYFVLQGALAVGVCLGLIGVILLLLAPTTPVEGKAKLLP